MKLSYALLAMAAATETTVPSVDTTATAAVTEAAATAAVTEAATTAGEATTEASTEDVTAAATEDVTIAATEDVTTAATAAVDEAALAGCKEAQKTLAATTNSIEKVAATAACELACTAVENETCGFLVNGLSLILVSILTVFKY